MVEEETSMNRREAKSRWKRLARNATVEYPKDEGANKYQTVLPLPEEEQEHSFRGTSLPITKSGITQLNHIEEEQGVVLGAQMDCVRPHFFEIFITYRFLFSYRNQLCEFDQWNIYQDRYHENKMNDQMNEKRITKEIDDSIRRWNPELWE